MNDVSQRTCAHIFQKRQLGELLGAGTVNRAYAVFIKNRELCSHQDNMYLYPPCTHFYIAKGWFTGVNSYCYKTEIVGTH